MKDGMKRGFGAFFGIKIRLWMFILACALCVGATSYVCTTRERAKLGDTDSYEQALKYLEVKSVLDQYYVGDVDEEAVSAAAFTAMVQALGDKWSYYMSPAEYQTYQLYSENQYAGIGVTIEADTSTGGYRVSSVKGGSPAETAGIQVGEIILAVDEESVIGLKTNEVRNLITAKLDESVVMKLKRLDGNEADVTVDCRIVYTNPVSSELKSGNVGYIRIDNFQTGAAENAIAAIEELINKGAVGFVFDLRSNPGGLLSELVDLLDYILPAGDIFVSVNEAGEEKITKSDNVCLSMPMAVLINSNSYSAAEFFAAALSEYSWATTVGERTTGKARSQITLELSDGSAVHISSNKYLTPNRVDLSEQGGLRPDIEVELGETGDAQLDAAINSVIMRT